MLGAGAAAAAAVYLAKADPADAGIWAAVSGVAGVVTLYFGGSSPAAWGKDKPA
jgi:hypothetical protein